MIIFALEAYFCIVIASTHDFIKEQKRYEKKMEEEAREKINRSMSINPFIKNINQGEFNLSINNEYKKTLESNI